MPRPTGTVNLSLPSCSQLMRMFGDMPMSFVEPRDNWLLTADCVAAIVHHDAMAKFPSPAGRVFDTDCASASRPSCLFVARLRLHLAAWTERIAVTPRKC
jgi:hypothetical protein